MIEKNTNSSNKPSDVVYESIEEESAIEFIATDESSETHKNWEEIEDQTIQEMPEIVINEEIEDQTIQELPEILELINPAKNDLGNYLNHNISDETKKIIINCGPHRPKGPFPKDPEQQNRCFTHRTTHHKITLFGKGVFRSLYSIHVIFYIANKWRVWKGRSVN